jgi:hypothetical protein
MKKVVEKIKGLTKKIGWSKNTENNKTLVEDLKPKKNTLEDTVISKEFSNTDIVHFKKDSFDFPPTNDQRWNILFQKKIGDEWRFFNEIRKFRFTDNLDVFFNQRIFLEGKNQTLDKYLKYFMELNNIEKIKVSFKTGRAFNWKNYKSELIKHTDLVDPTKIKNNPRDSNCMMFHVNKKENISLVSNTIANLPKGYCSIELIAENQNKKRFINNKIRIIRKQNKSVSEYFNDPDTGYEGTAKWKIIQMEMNDSNNPIEKILVKVCKL